MLAHLQLLAGLVSHYDALLRLHDFTSITNPYARFPKTGFLDAV